MQSGRTQNTTRNAVWGLIEKLIQTILPFVTRTLILKLIGEEYLGLNSLFTSILSVLNMADLGFGAAITYSMYKPIADQNYTALSALINYYKKIYQIVGSVIFVAGLILMPFLPALINGDIPADINIYLLFGIYLTNTVLSYWLFAYKKSLLHAYHRDDITTKISSALMVVQYGLQILMLALFHSYYVYVAVLPLITLLSNIASAIATKKLYPQVICKGKVEKETSKQITKQVSGAFIGKASAAVRASVNNVFISAFLSLTHVAIYGNYYYILSAVHSILTVFTNSMVGGVGNSIAKESVEKNYKDFKKFTFLYAWLSGWFACCMLCLYQPFMHIWTGKELMLPFGTMVLFCFYLYVMGASDIRNVYYSARGLWWEGRFRALLDLIVTLVLNFVGVKLFGIFGILLGTILSMAFVNFLYGGKVLFDHYFKEQSLSEYLLQHLLYLTVTVAVGTATYLICGLLPDVGIIWLGVKASICAVVPNSLFFAVYRKTQVFQEIVPLFKSILSGATGKIKRR